MTGLSSAISNALSGLLVSAGQSALVSRNVTRANDADYSRRDVGLGAAFDGTVRLGNYVRSEDRTLLAKVLSANAGLGATSTTSEALGVLSRMIGDPQDKTSVAAGLYELQSALSQYEGDPNSTAFASAAVSAARELVRRVNEAATAVADVRDRAQAGVEASVQTINARLAELKTTDASIVALPAGSDRRAELLDRRDAIIKELSLEIGLRVVPKSDGGVALYTDSGVTLFDVSPRTVEIRGTYSPTVNPGPGVFIDGVNVTGTSPMGQIAGGRLAGQIAVRDDIAPGEAAKLDEIARALVTQFAETDQSPSPSLPAMTGLFTSLGSGGTVPPGATQVPGLAQSLRLNPLYDDRVGGNPALIRDGGANGAAYIYNSAGLSGFQGRLTALVATLDQPFVFDPAAGLPSSSSLLASATAAAGGLEARRADAEDASDRATAVHQNWSEALLRKTGVNLDEELAALLNLEKSYQASAKVMSTLDQMFGVLVGIVR